MLRDVGMHTRSVAADTPQNWCTQKDLLYYRTMDIPHGPEGGRLIDCQLRELLRTCQDCSQLSEPLKSYFSEHAKTSPCSVLLALHVSVQLRDSF